MKIRQIVKQLDRMRAINPGLFPISFRGAQTLSMLADGPMLTTEVGEALGISETATRSLLNTLHKRGLIWKEREKAASSFNYRWGICDE